eukprot:1160705-Pelagomonas_calceolata.AAC.15
MSPPFHCLCSTLFELHCLPSTAVGIELTSGLTARLNANAARLNVNAARLDVDAACNGFFSSTLIECERIPCSVICIKTFSVQPNLDAVESKMESSTNSKDAPVHRRSRALNMGQRNQN